MGERETLKERGEAGRWSVRERLKGREGVGRAGGSEGGKGVGEGGSERQPVVITW